MSLKTIAIILAAGALTSAASAGIQMTATITADNHYALFTGTPLNLTMVGHNELGAAGNPGPFNWSQAETFNFIPGTNIYIAAWSDDSVAQGLLAQISLGDQTFNSGDERWRVYKTDVNRNDNDPVPTLAEMNTHIIFASDNERWRTTFVGDANGAQPWGTIAGIGPNVRWMWADVDGDPDPTRGGSDEGEMLIFRMTNVPTPGAVALLGLGGLALARRRR